MCNLSSYVENIGVKKGIEIGMQKGIKIGMRKGIKIGMRKGEAIGIQKGTVNTMKRLVRDGIMTVEKASEYFGVPVEKVREISFE